MTFHVFSFCCFLPGAYSGPMFTFQGCSGGGGQHGGNSGYPCLILNVVCFLNLESFMIFIPAFVLSCLVNAHVNKGDALE